MSPAQRFALKVFALARQYINRQSVEDLERIVVDPRESPLVRQYAKEELTTRTAA